MQDTKIFCICMKKKYFYVSNKQNKKYQFFGVFMHLGQNPNLLNKRYLSFNMYKYLLDTKIK